MEVGAGGKTVKTQTVAAGAPAPKSNVPLPAASTAPAPGVAAYLQAMNSANQSAEAQFMATMQSSGAWTQAQLSQIASWATGQITGQGQPNGLPVPEAQVALNFAQTPMFQQRFPGMAALEKQGLSITPAAYVAAESGYMAAATAATSTPKLIAAHSEGSGTADRLLICMSKLFPGYIPPAQL